MDTSRAQRLEALAEAARAVLHDMRNDLAVAMGTSEILLERLEDTTLREDLEKVLDVLQRVTASAGWSQQLLHDGPPEEPFDVGRLISGLIEGLAPSLGVPRAAMAAARRADAGTLFELLSRIFGAPGERPSAVQLGVQRSGPGNKLPPGDYARVSVTGCVLEPPPDWSPGLETFKLRASGGDLTVEADRVTVLLPLQRDARPRPE